MGKTQKVIQKGDPMIRLKNQIKSVLCNPFNLITLIAFIVLIAFVVVPLVSLIKQTLVLDGTAARRAKVAEGTWSIYYWQYLLTGKMAKSMFWIPLSHSLVVSVCSCLVAVPLGAILAWLMVRSDIPGKKVLSFLIVIAYMMPSWCKSQAWLSIFRNTLGGAPGILYGFGWKVPDWIAYGPFAMVCVLSLHYYAFTYIMLAGSLGTINSELEEMALIQGASKKNIVMQITLPLVMPAFLSATIMTFSKALGGYSVASYLGMRVKYYTLSTRLHDQIGSGMSGVGYAMFPLSDSGNEITSFPEVMHMAVTVLVVVLSIVSLILLILSGIRKRETRTVGIFAAVAFGMMMAGAIGINLVPAEYFGIAERFSVFAAVGFTAVLGTALYNSFHIREEGSEE